MLLLFNYNRKNGHPHYSKDLFSNGKELLQCYNIPENENTSFDVDISDVVSYKNKLKPCTDWEFDQTNYQATATTEVPFSKC